MEMTRPAIAVSVLRAAAAGWPAPGTKVIQRACPQVKKALRAAGIS